MRFYCIYQKKDNPEKTAFLLESAAKRNGIEFIHIDPEVFDFSKISPLEKGDALYRISSDNISHVAERVLIKPDTATFYAFYERAFTRYEELIFFERNNISTPKTVHCASKNYDLLKKYVEYLGGFPIILKVSGKQGGAGLLKVESLDALSSMVRFVRSDPKASFSLKEFIETRSSFRAIVIGNEVVGSITYTSKRGDFRSNIEKNPEMMPVELSEEIKSLAISAIKSKDIEFGGVDIVIDKNGRVFVLEANFPCFFPDVQKTTGIDIAELIVKYLIKKSSDITG